MAITAYDPYDPTDANAVFTDDVLIPEVMAGLVLDKTREKMVFRNVISEDSTTLVNRPGNTVTLPKFKHLDIIPNVGEKEISPLLPVSAEEVTVSVSEISGTVQFSESALEDTFKQVRDFYVNELGVSGAQKIDTDFINAATASSAGSKPLVQNLTAANTLDWATIVDGLVQWGDNGWGEALGLITTPAGYGSLAKNPDFMADARATSTRATNGLVGSVAGMPIYVTSALNTVTKGKVGAVAVREGALSLFWKRLPTIAIQESARYRGLDIVYSARYAAYRADDNGIILFNNPTA